MCAIFSDNRPTKHTPQLCTKEANNIKFSRQVTTLQNDK